MVSKYKKMEDTECMICFDEVNDTYFTYCTNCKKMYHRNCYDKWILKCKEKKNPYKQCLHCQSKKTIKKNKFFLCYEYFIDIR